MPAEGSSDINIAALQQLSAVQGQLTTIVQLIQHQHESTNKRIDDFRTAADSRFTGLETRMGTMERNERDTAIKAAGAGALAGAIVSAGMALLKMPIK